MSVSMSSNRMSTRLEALEACQTVLIGAVPIGAVGSALAGQMQPLGDAINFRQLRLLFRSEVKASMFNFYARCKPA